MRDDRLVAAALVAMAAICLAFRYLPMVDLPQHHAMVSILAHYQDPSFGFERRFSFDFLGRPYATVYLFGAALAKLLPLRAAMRIVVALCTIAPLAGAWALTAALGRPRFWILAAAPFAFGALWSWGFLNFLLGTGLLLALLALMIRQSFVALGVGAMVLLFTHFHGLALLILLAPIFGGRLRALVALSPAALAGAAFVAFTWHQADGKWDRMDPGFLERIRLFPEFLGQGLPVPLGWLGGFLALSAIAFVLGPRRLSRACLVAIALQVVLYFTLPLNTATATFVSARHALLIILFALPLLPDARRLRIPCALFCVVALVIETQHLRCFDAEARAVDPLLDRVAPNRRIASLMFDPGSRCCAGFPYLHFAAYAQADHGGDLARSFAVVWNVPIRYRADYPRHPIREEIEWQPQLFSRDDLSHYDYVLVRAPAEGAFPADWPAHLVLRSGEWSLFEIL